MEIHQLKYNSQCGRFMVGEYELHAQDWLHVLIPDQDAVQKRWREYSSDCDFLLGYGNDRTDWTARRQIQKMLFDCLFHSPWHQSMILYNHGATGKDRWYLEHYPDSSVGCRVCGDCFLYMELLRRSVRPLRRRICPYTGRSTI